jgi:NADH:ubiquinone oxidoreductase subunit C
MEPHIKTDLSALTFAELSGTDENLTVTVPKEHLYETARFLRYECSEKYDFLIDIVGMDYGAELGVIYYLSQ